MPMREALRSASGISEIVVLIGPEGGFSGREAALAGERGFVPVSLGPTILRTETAAVAALSMMVYELA